MPCMIKSKGRIVLLRDGKGGPMRQVGPSEAVMFYALDADQFEADGDVEAFPAAEKPKRASVPDLPKSEPAPVKRRRGRPRKVVTE